MYYKTTMTGIISDHLWIGLLIRFSFVAYGLFHDRYFNVKFTDADYNVFNSGVKAILNFKSPYEEDSEYRYSPLLAFLLVPNVLHHAVGKLLFSTVDLLVAIMIYKIVSFLYKNESKPLQCSKLWLYNPFSIIIAARGNFDSLIAFLTLSILYRHVQKGFLSSGILLGLAVHLRLYPIVFLFPLFITIDDRHIGFFKRLYPSKKKLQFLFGFFLTYGLLTYLFYHLYGEPFLRQTVLYHLNRLDVRHNFSIHFYSFYLNLDNIYRYLLPKEVLFVVPQIITTLFYSFTYDRLQHLHFAMFCTAFTFVTFNKVITSQYIIWYLSLLPVFLPTISLSRRKVTWLVGCWIFAQTVWLSSAYALEFEGYNTFVYIWIGSVLFFWIHVYILKTFIERYNDEVFDYYFKRSLSTVKLD